MAQALVDRTTYLLFNRFPREVSLDRIVVNNFDQFEKYIYSSNGLHINHCFTSVQSRNNILDKLTFDYDYGSGHAFEIAQKCFHAWTTDLHAKDIPILSGRKGYHNHLLFNPIHVESEEEQATILKKAAYAVLKDVLPVYQSEIDTHLVGNPRAVIRIPNTSRPPKNDRWCTYLPPDFDNYNKKEIEDMAFEPHSYQYLQGKKLDFYEIIEGISLDDANHYFGSFPHHQVQDKQYQGIVSSFDEGAVVCPLDIQELLFPILRPCLFNHIIRSYPRHEVRLYAAMDLLEHMNKELICTLFSHIGWFDFDYNTTMYYLDYILKNYGSGPTCDTLRKAYIPTECCKG